MTITISGGTNYVDWICVIVGLSSGSLQFYSDNGAILYEKSLHNESILNTRIIGEEITVFYPTCIIVLQINHLIPLLKSLREMYSKAKTTKIDLMDKDYMLAFKKWDYKSNELVISDALMIPQQKTCLFDHLLTESLELGFSKKYRITPSQNASVVSIGSRPFVSFHSAREGFRQNVLTGTKLHYQPKTCSTDTFQLVNFQMLQKLLLIRLHRDYRKFQLLIHFSKSSHSQFLFLRSWLTGTQPQQSLDNEYAENNSETLYPKHELIDYQRMGCNIYMAPNNHQLCAVTDNLGRIILMNTLSGTMIRIWKGYREAQCGFLEVSEARSRKDQSTDSRRSGLFLVIYAPRKAIMEIWCLQKGPKVATFQASRNGFLIYNNHEAVQSKSSKKDNKGSCMFFDADDNSFKVFSIPFHCILSETNSKSAEDFHYLKKIKMTLKNVDLTEPSGVACISELCEKLETSEIRLKCLELLTNYRKTDPNMIMAVTENFLKVPEAGSKDADEHVEDIEDTIYRSQLVASCRNYQSLIKCFLMATQKKEEDSDPVPKASIELLDNEYQTVMRIVELMSFSKVRESRGGAKNVSFKDNEESVVSFLSSFVVASQETSILVNTELQKNALDHIGSVLFTNVWSDEFPLPKLLDIFETSRITSDDIMKCFLHFWLKQDLNFSNEDNILAEMTKFKLVLDQVCEFAAEKVAYAYNSICIFWQNAREYLLESNNPINSLLAAIICKNYALKQQIENQDFGFEQVTQEECQWTLLTEKLNDVAVLSIFVSQLGNQQSSRDKYEIPKISLKKILNDGKGIISELVANWLIGANLPIEMIFKSSTDEGLEADEKNVIKKLEILRQHFPYSLHASVILCYVIWELLSGRWSKNLSEMHHLKSGIQYLKLFDEKDYQLKQGLCVMLWNGNFKIPLKALQKLINKTGRLPKEKLCLQNTMIPDFLIPQFLEQTILFLEHFRDSNNYTKFEFKCEEILTQGSSSQPMSLCELILQQPRGNLTLLKLHHEMVQVLELIAFLNIKYTKPMSSLFDEVSNEAFFMDINKQLPYSLVSPDEIRMNTRVFFMKKAVNTTIDLIIECQDNVYFDDHQKWIGKIKAVGEIWNLEIALLERHHVSNSKRSQNLG